MAEQQPQNTQTQEAQNPTARVQNNEEESLYWCYQCNREVTLQHHEGEEAQTLCIECNSGFVEALASTEGVIAPGDRRGRRPRRMSNRAFSGAYQRNVLRALRLIAENTQLNARIQRVRARDENTQSEGRVNSQERSLGESEANFGHPDGGFGDRRENLGHPQAASAEQQPNFGHPENAVVDVHPNFGHPQDASVERSPISEHPQSVSENNQSDLGRPQGESVDNQTYSVQSQLEDASENGNNVGVDAGESLEDEEDDGNVFNIELDMWDSFEYDDEDDDDGGEDDEEENDTWEEVAEGQDEEPVEGGAVLNSGENIEEINETGVDGQRRPNRRRDVLRLRIRDWNSQSPGAVLETSGRNLDWNEIMQALENNSIELRLSLPEEDTYVGNPGDYVDDAGYEILLQNFAENDNTHRGAPPAAKSAIEGLPSVAIHQEKIDSAAAMCAVCKDNISLGDIGKQLPCQHLYHGHCIIPWLNYRNSCPICRYELPTDDADYEEQKKQRTTSQSTVSDTSMASSEEGLSQVEDMN